MHQTPSSESHLAALRARLVVLDRVIARLERWAATGSRSEAPESPQARDARVSAYRDYIEGHVTLAQYRALIRAYSVTTSRSISTVSVNRTTS
jgi:hypothetical protein